MKIWILGAAFCCTFIACAKPIADFRIAKDKSTAPTHVRLENTSVGADNYVWIIDKDTISNDTDASHLFLESGRHTIELLSTKGSKQSKSTKEIILTAPTTCMVHMETNYGSLTLALSEETPIHRDNFIQLVEAGYYNGIRFHRVIDGFMIQAGDHKTRITKNKVQHEEQIQQEITDKLIHHKGALAAARMPDNINPDRASSGTQFYIVDGRELTRDVLFDTPNDRLSDYTKEQVAQYISEGGTPQLDGAYTVFGYLVEGYDTLEKISQVKTGIADFPEDNVVIKKAFVID